MCMLSYMRGTLWLIARLCSLCARASACARAGGTAILLHVALPDDTMQLFVQQHFHVGGWHTTSWIDLRYLMPLMMRP